MGNTFIHVGQTGHWRQVVCMGDRGPIHRGDVVWETHLHMECRQGIGDKFHIGETWYAKHIYTCRADRALETSYT